MKKKKKAKATVEKLTQKMAHLQPRIRACSLCSRNAQSSNMKYECEMRTRLDSLYRESTHAIRVRVYKFS